jgi:pyrroloquinoline quinone (PQQ) biosynthesis protein C
VRDTDTHPLCHVFEEAIGERQLLTHPYYTRWQEGALRTAELRDYAEQYRHFERCLPEVLRGVAEELEEGEPRRLVEENLRDECSRPIPHSALFEGFATAVGADSDAGLTPATEGLVGLYQRASSGPVAKLCVIGAYEFQAAQIARTKSEALRRNYGISAMGTRFWDVHAEMEESHAGWTLSALEGLGAPVDLVLQFARESSEAWWEFLDERDTSI